MELQSVPLEILEQIFGHFTNMDLSHIALYRLISKAWADLVPLLRVTWSPRRWPGAEGIKAMAKLWPNVETLRVPRLSEEEEQTLSINDLEPFAHSLRQIIWSAPCSAVAVSIIASLPKLTSIQVGDVDPTHPKYVLDYMMLLAHKHSLKTLAIGPLGTLKRGNNFPVCPEFSLEKLPVSVEQLRLEIEPASNERLMQAIQLPKLTRLESLMQHAATRHILSSLPQLKRLKLYMEFGLHYLEPGADENLPHDQAMALAEQEFMEWGNLLPEQLERLDLTMRSDYTPHLTRLSRLTHLRLSHPYGLTKHRGEMPDMSEYVDSFSCLKRLEVLALVGKAGDHIVRSLSQLSSLRTLFLEASNAGDLHEFCSEAALESLGQLPRLEFLCLHLGSLRVPNVLSRMTHLNALDLAVTDLDELKKIPSSIKVLAVDAPVTSAVTFFDKISHITALEGVFIETMDAKSYEEISALFRLMTANPHCKLQFVHVKQVEHPQAQRHVRVNLLRRRPFAPPVRPLKKSRVLDLEEN